MFNKINMIFRVFLLICLNFCLISSNILNKRFLDEVPDAEITATTTTPLPPPPPPPLSSSLSVEDSPASSTTTPLLVIVPSTIPQTLPPLPAILTTIANITEEVVVSDQPVVVPSSTTQPILDAQSEKSTTPVLVSTTTTAVVVADEIAPVSEAISTTTVLVQPSSTTQDVIASSTVPSQTEPIQVSTTVPSILSSTVPASLPAQDESTTTSPISTSNIVEDVILTTTPSIIDETISTTTLSPEQVILVETTTSGIAESINLNEKAETTTPNDSESNDQDQNQDSSSSETNQIATTTPIANIIICFTKPIASSSNQKKSQSYMDHLDMNPTLVKFKNFTLNIIPSRVYDLMKHPSSDLILLTVLIVFIILIVLLIITMCFVFRRRNYATTSLYKRFVENHLVINSSPLNDIPPGETNSNYDNRTIVTRIRTLKGDHEKNENDITTEQNITLITESPKQNDTNNKKKSNRFLLNKNNNLKCHILDPTTSKAVSTTDKDNQCSDKIHLVKVKNNCFPKLSLFNINPIYVDDKTKIENTHL